MRVLCRKIARSIFLLPAVGMRRIIFKDYFTNVFNIKVEDNTSYILYRSTLLTLFSCIITLIILSILFIANHVVIFEFKSLQIKSVTQFGYMFSFITFFFNVLVNLPISLKIYNDNFTTDCMFYKINQKNYNSKKKRIFFALGPIILVIFLSYFWLGFFNTLMEHFGLKLIKNDFLAILILSLLFLIFIPVISEFALSIFISISAANKITHCQNHLTSKE